MKKQFHFLKKNIALFFGSKAAAVYVVLFAAAIGIATFIENDFGTSSAQKIIFQSWWFELLLALFSLSILVSIFKYNLIKKKKWAILLFHAAIIIILIGAGITRYFGSEGIMHIRENSSSNTFLSSNTYLKFTAVKGSNSYNFDDPVLFATLGNNNWHRSYLIGDDLIDVRVQEFIPNPREILQEDINGMPVLKVVVGGMNGREEYFIQKGETKSINNVVFNFKEGELPDAFNLSYKGDSLLFRYNKPVTQMQMISQTKEAINPSDTYKPLKLRSLYSDGNNSFVFADFNKSGKITVKSGGHKVKSGGQTALQMLIKVNDEPKQTLVIGNKGLLGKPEVLDFSALSLSVSYGAKNIHLPFSIKLKDFIMDKYPGTNSASSYASEVQLIDTRKNTNKDFRIYMNNILNYGGYRFFQSSYDMDEKGTYLSVNHDYWGTLISYLGYILLTIGMLLTLFSKKTRFHQLRENIKKLRGKGAISVIVVFMLFSSNYVMGQPKNTSPGEEHVISAEHADLFSKLIVQDYRGRMKPVHTLTREVMRKLSRKESWHGLNADQVFLGIFVNGSDWYDVKIVKLGKSTEIQKKLGVTGKYASYRDFFTDDGTYKLGEEVQKANTTKPVDRGVYEKELLKIDERVNILNMVFTGALLKIVPDANAPDQAWLSAYNHGTKHEPEVAGKFFAAYIQSLRNALTNNDYSDANGLVEQLKSYQNNYGGAIVPSKSKINAEIFLNKARIFNRLSTLYVLLGLSFLFFLFLSVFKPKVNLNTIYKVLFMLVLAGFAIHTLGLALRWYISGRAPWSNGYESMIYIAWTATLSGILFTRKSFGGLAATTILAATILSVSTLSFLDPEITPLVPVLKSYWLTIHVSMEAGSYGFLLLGALIGLINLLLIAFMRESTKASTLRILKEMSYISELTLIGGLFMLSIGTYLGGVWANESWGRYWGWDAKETWALVTILVYAFILHMRLIPKLKGLYAFNLATIFGMASVLMTYFGVNYYLSGLHSYASGDPVPIPTWVYYVVASIIVIGAVAYFKKRKYLVN
jgi:cytochrome c-type biogenesis protein CcsB